MGLPVELQANEKVIMRVRRHRIFIMTPMLLIALAAILPSVILILLAGPIGAVLALVWIVVMLVVAYLRWYRYFHDEWIVTNQRIIDSYKKHWFHQTLSSADLINVQDMQVKKSGVLATLYNFGDLYCETAGTQQNFILSQIPDPTKVLDKIDEARDLARRSVTQPVQ